MQKDIPRWERLLQHKIKFIKDKIKSMPKSEHVFGHEDLPAEDVDEGLEKFKLYMHEAFDEAEENVKEGTDEDTESEEDDDDTRELTRKDIRTPLVQEFIGKMRALMPKLEKMAKAMESKKEMKRIRVSIREVANDFFEENKVYFDDELDDMLVDKLAIKYRDIAFTSIKRVEEEKRDDERFRGSVGHVTDPDGREHTWRNKRSYDEISAKLRQKYKDIFEEFGNFEHPEVQKWNKFITGSGSGTLKHAVDKFYKSAGL